jgi:hypothetical protein
MCYYLYYFRNFGSGIRNPGPESTAKTEDETALHPRQSSLMVIAPAVTMAIDV